MKMDILDMLLYKLDIVSSIPKGKFLYRSKKYISVDDNNILHFIKRLSPKNKIFKIVQMIGNDIQTLIYIGSHIGSHIETYIVSCNNKNNLSIDDFNKYNDYYTNLLKIICSLNNVKHGLYNISYTYYNDSVVNRYLHSLYNDIDLFILTINNYA